MNRPELKIRMMNDEMAELFKFDHPELFPTKQAVGRYAKQIGYRVQKQKLNGKQIYFYVKKSIPALNGK